MMITGQKPRSKSEMLKGLKPGFIKSKLTGRNTIKAEYPDGSIIVRYWDTDVVTINPDKSVILTSGGFMTKTTKERIEENTRIRIAQKNFIWYIVRNIHDGWPIHSGSLPLFYDGIHISESGKILSGIKKNPENVIREFKRDLKRLTDKITKENIPLPNAGDCWICGMDRAQHKATSDHLISHVKEGYLHGSLIVLCLELSGYNPGVHIQLKFVDSIRRCVRKVISDTCIPVLLNNPECYKDVE